MSVATLSYNMLGYLPAPFIYGIVSDLPLNDKVMQQRLALASILYMSIATESFLIAAYAIKFQVCSNNNDFESIVEKPISEWHAHGFEEIDNEFENLQDLQSGAKRFRYDSKTINKIVESESDSASQDH